VLASIVQVDTEHYNKSFTSRFRENPRFRLLVESTEGSCLVSSILIARNYDQKFSSVYLGKITHKKTHKNKQRKINKQK